MEHKKSNSMTKGHEPKSVSGGMASHLPASEGNNPMTSRKCDLSFGGENKGELTQVDAKKSGNKCVASNQSGV